VEKGDLVGATHERIADPWLARHDRNGRGFNSMGTIYMSEQSLDLLLQTVEMYRTGREQIYIGENLTTKVYPDAVCYYSKDITGLKEIPFMVVPSSGTLVLKVEDWKIDKRSWTISEVRDSSVSLNISMGDLNDNSWYTVTKNGEIIGDYQSNYRGELYFTVSGIFSGTTTFEMIKKN
jgi:hypothetical protein